jgi:hypothetical protein
MSTSDLTTDEVEFVLWALGVIEGLADVDETSRAWAARVAEKVKA